MRKDIIRGVFLIIRRVKSYCLSDLPTDRSTAADTNLKVGAIKPVRSAALHIERMDATGLPGKTARKNLVNSG